MKNTDILSRITALLNKKVELAQMQLENGTVVESDSFSVGDPIFAINGEIKEPLEIGSFTLADGTVLEVMEIGVIGEIASAPAEATEEEMKALETAELARIESAELAKTESENELILKVVESLKPTFDELNQRIENLSKENVGLKKTLSSVTATKPTVHKPTEKVALGKQNTGANISGTESRIMAMLSK